MTRGPFITFEGPDGCGKTTQMRMLEERLKNEGHQVITSVEPGGTPVGMRIRRILLDDDSSMTWRTELFLFLASRIQNTEAVIQPAMARGEVVLCDRYLDSSFAYQCGGRGLDEDVLRRGHDVAIGSFRPDLTLLYDIDVDAAHERMFGRRTNGTAVQSQERFDKESREFHTRVREKYLAMAAAEPQRFRILDGRLGIDALHEITYSHVRPLMDAYKKGTLVDAR